MISSNQDQLDPNVPIADEDIPVSLKESEALLRRIEAYVHSEGRYDFDTMLLPSAEAALANVGFA
jgi:hypothetical protein